MLGRRSAWADLTSSCGTAARPARALQLCSIGPLDYRAAACQKLGARSQWAGKIRSTDVDVLPQHRRSCDDQSVANSFFDCRHGSASGRNSARDPTTSSQPPLRCLNSDGQMERARYIDASPAFWRRTGELPPPSSGRAGGTAPPGSRHGPASLAPSSYRISIRSRRPVPISFEVNRGCHHGLNRREPLLTPLSARVTA